MILREFLSILHIYHVCISLELKKLSYIETSRNWAHFVLCSSNPQMGYWIFTYINNRLYEVFIQESQVVAYRRQTGDHSRSMVHMRKSKRNHKNLLKERKKELMSHRKGKVYSLVCWAILFVGIINLLLGEFSISTWKAAKLEAVLHDLDPVNLHQKFIYYVKTRKFSSFADFFLLKSERRRCG